MRDERERERKSVVLIKEMRIDKNNKTFHNCTIFR